MKLSTQATVITSFIFSTFLLPSLAPAPVSSQTTIISRQSQVIKANSTIEVVQRFNRNTQLYIIGNPISQSSVDRLVRLLGNNPNIFVVLVSSSQNVKQDDLTLSRGIRNNPAFQSVINPVTKERERVLIMVYFNSDKGRQIFFLTEQLPDRLGVGEKSPRLLSTFRSEFGRTQNMVDGLEAVIKLINGTIRNSVLQYNSDDRHLARGQSPFSMEEQTEFFVAQASSAGDRNNQLILGVIGVVVLFVHAISFLLTKKRREEAIDLFPPIEDKLRRKTEELLELMQTADYTSIASYTGETGAMVQKAVNELNECLVLLGGAKKILAEAKQIIERRDIFSLLYPFASGRAVKLLTDRNTKFTFSGEDALQAIAQANPAWQEQFRQTQRQEVQLSYPDIMTDLEEKQRRSHQSLMEVVQKDAEIEGLLKQVEQQTGQFIPIVQNWQQSGIPEFNGKQLGLTLFPHILGSQGLLAQARSAMTKDPVGVWNNYGKTIERLNKEAQIVIDICQQAQAHLLPQSEQTLTILGNNGITTDWIRSIRRELSDRLDQLAAHSIHTSSEQGLEQIKREIADFQQQMQTAIQQDEQRRIVLPNQIKEVENTIEQTRQQIASIYQTRGIHFSSHQVLQENDRNPTDRVTASLQELQQIKSSLDWGDVRQAAEQIKRIEQLLEEAKTICADSLSFLNNYTNELNKVKNYRKSIADKISLNFQPVADRLIRTYHPDALSQVASELNCSPTVANIIERVNNQLANVVDLIKQAEEDYTRGALLASRDRLTEGTNLSQEGERLLQALPRAEQLLKEKERLAREEIAKVQREVDYTVRRKTEFYARDRARQMCSRIEIQMRDVNNVITLTPQNPYRVEELLFQLQQQLDEAKRELDNDEEAEIQARRNLERLESVLSSTKQICDEARSTRFTYATVRFNYRSLDSETFELYEIRNQYEAKAFETASQRASYLISTLERIADDARQAIEDVRREDEMERDSRASYSSSDYESSYASYDSGSSGGSWSDSSSSGSGWSESSGSSGGSWNDDKESGSSGGSW